MAVTEKSTTKKITPTRVTPEIARLRVRAYDLLTQSMNVKSKFYDEDCNDVWTAILRKDKEQLLETIGRWSYVPTQKEINIHCQFAGLPKVGK